MIITESLSHVLRASPGVSHCDTSVSASEAHSSPEILIVSRSFDAFFYRSLIWLFSVRKTSKSSQSRWSFDSPHLSHSWNFFVFWRQIWICRTYRIMTFITTQLGNWGCGFSVVSVALAVRKRLCSVDWRFKLLQLISFDSIFRPIRCML